MTETEDRKISLEELEETLNRLYEQYTTRGQNTLRDHLIERNMGRMETLLDVRAELGL